MVILWYGLITTFLGSLATSICMWLWYWADDRANEPFYTAIATSIVAVLAGGGIVIQYLFDERLLAARRARKEQEKADQKRLLDRIEHEWSNFEHIRDKEKYNSENHRRAVEDVSIELLADELGRIRGKRTYRKLADQALAETARIKEMPPRQKDVSRLLPIVDRIRSKLSNYVNP